ncbi:MAG: SUF system NifU family Fe-S cluster assembly protein [Puniceicoccales bacterium]|jgi:nitrogen fixation NifU-like protein|nr:SUF system NifU family Fe-S cluster assembly protein [Puniceicoccales bacterium]
MINTEIDNLYKEIILDHYKNPRNYGRPTRFTTEANGTNPSCGDEVTVYLTISQGMITDVNFECSGCAISMASASIMSENVKFKRLEDALALSASAQCFLTTSDNLDYESIKKATDILALAGVRNFPMRIKCATLVWHALDQSIFNISGC